MKVRKSNIMSYFIEAIKEKFWPSFINRKNKYKWIGVHSVNNANPNHKEYTIVKKQKSKDN
tara:strand:+ start:2114 stop:2296 length:183 start_codon:yes stop_codon:yes gene_type:complete